MRHRALVLASAALAFALVAGLAAQGQATFPAQQRPPGDPALIERGRAIYDISCRSCHGADLRGGDIGGPNLLRSQTVLNDEQGELILPIVRDGMSTPGMPAMPAIGLSSDDVRAVAEYLHSVLATAQGQGAPPRGPEVELKLLVGDAGAGQAYFAAHCATCHSPEGDLRGIGARIPDPKALQNTWVRGGGGRGRGAGPGPASQRRQVTVTVTLPTGERVEGRLDRLDDFLVVLTMAVGSPRSFARRGAVPAVEVNDPMARHTELLTLYTDPDIHDVTAYLSTLR